VRLCPNRGFPRLTRPRRYPPKPFNYSFASTTMYAAIGIVRKKPTLNKYETVV
jgi:hypothetical protein